MTSLLAAADRQATLWRITVNDDASSTRFAIHRPAQS